MNNRVPIIQLPPPKLVYQKKMVIITNLSMCKKRLCQKILNHIYYYVVKSFKSLSGIQELSRRYIPSTLQELFCFYNLFGWLYHYGIHPVWLSVIQVHKTILLFPHCPDPLPYKWLEWLIEFYRQQNLWIINEMICSKRRTRKKLWVPDGNWAHDLPYTSRVL